MDFNPSDEQRMLADSVSRFVQNRYDLDRRRIYRDTSVSYSEENWRMLVDIGITALALPGRLGGLDGTLADVAAVMEQLGKGLVVEPVISSAVIATRLLAASSAHADLATAAAAGECRVAVAFADPPASRAGAAEPLRYEALDDGFRLNGVKTLALQCLGADAVIFPCMGAQGFAAFLIDPNALAGIDRKDYRLLDGTLASEFSFGDAMITSDMRMSLLADDWADAKAWGNIASCAKLSGIIERLLDETADYLRTRQQFGVPIGTFQALQHRMARMRIEYEKARALLYRAMLPSRDTVRREAIDDCRHFVGRVGIEIGESCLHLHGGMGITDELFVGDALKRLNFLYAFISLE